MYAIKVNSSTDHTEEKSGGEHADLLHRCVFTHGSDASALSCAAFKAASSRWCWNFLVETPKFLSNEPKSDVKSAHDSAMIRS